MPHDSYASVACALNAIGITGQMSRPFQLVVSSQQGAPWPNRGNSFWLSHKDGEWYLSTWLPACYRIPGDQDIVELCAACMEASASAMYRVPSEIAERFSLEDVPDEVFNQLFPADDAEEVDSL